MSRLCDDIRRRHPRKARKADAGRSALTALRLFCLECQSDSAAGVRSCPCDYCFLWPYRTRSADIATRRPESVPTEEEYDQLEAAQPRREMPKAARQALEAYRASQGDEKTDNDQDDDDAAED